MAFRLSLRCCADPLDELDLVMDGWQTTGPAYQDYQFLTPARTAEIEAETLVDDYVPFSDGHYASDLGIVTGPVLQFGYPPRDSDDNPFGGLLNDRIRITRVPDPWEGETEDDTFEWFQEPEYQEGTELPAWDYKQVNRLGAGRDFFYISEPIGDLYRIVVLLRLDTEHQSVVFLVYRNADLPDDENDVIIRSLAGLHPEQTLSVFVHRMKRGDYAFTVSDATNDEPIELTIVGPPEFTIPVNVDTVVAPQTGTKVKIEGVLGNTAANGEELDVTGHETNPNKFTVDGSTGNGAYAGGGLVRITEPLSGEMTSASIEASSVALQAPAANALVVEGATKRTFPKRIEITGGAGVRIEGCSDINFVGDPEAPELLLRYSQGEVRLRDVSRWSTIGPKTGEVTDVTGGELLPFTPVDNVLTITLPDSPKWRFADLFVAAQDGHGPFSRGDFDESEYAAEISSGLALPSEGISVEVVFSGDDDVITFTFDDPELTWPEEVLIGIYLPIIVTSVDHKLVEGEQVIFGSQYPEAEGNIFAPAFLYTHLPPSLTELVTGTTVIESAWQEDVTEVATVLAVLDDDRFVIGEHWGPIVYTLEEDPDTEDEYEILNIEFRLHRSTTGRILDFRRSEGGLSVLVPSPNRLRAGIPIHLAEDSTSDFGNDVRGRCEVVDLIEYDELGATSSQVLTISSGDLLIFSFGQPWSWYEGGTVLTPGVSTPAEVQTAFEAWVGFELDGDDPSMTFIGPGTGDYETWEYTLHHDPGFEEAIAALETSSPLIVLYAPPPIGVVVDRASPALPIADGTGATWKGSGQCGRSERIEVAGCEFDWHTVKLMRHLGEARGSAEDDIPPPEFRGTRATISIELPVA